MKKIKTGLRIFFYTSLIGVYTSTNFVLGQSQVLFQQNIPTNVEKKNISSPSLVPTRYPNQLLHCRNQLNTNITRSNWQSNTLFNQIQPIHLFSFEEIDHTPGRLQFELSPLFLWQDIIQHWKQYTSIVPGFSRWYHVANNSGNIVYGPSGTRLLSRIYFTNSGFQTSSSLNLYFDETNPQNDLNSTISALYPGVSKALNGVTNTTINWIAQPCITDRDAPTIQFVNIANNAYRVMSTGINYQITDNTNSANYLYPNGNVGGVYQFLSDDLNDLSLTNYAYAPTQNNQWGVDSGSLILRLNSINTNQLYDYSTLSMSDLNPIGGLTRNRIVRGYQSFYNNNFTFPVEEAISVTLTGADLSPYGPNTGTASITFNRPRNPYVYRGSLNTWPDGPMSGGVVRTGPLPNRSPTVTSNVSPQLDVIRFRVEDDRAGVDQNSLVVYLFTGDINQTMPPTNPAQAFKVYQGEQLNLQSVEVFFQSNMIAGSNATFHSNNFDITLTGFKDDFPDQRLPADTRFFVVVSGFDRAATPQPFVATNTQFADQRSFFYFDTRKDCSSLQCSNGVTIYTGNRSIDAPDALLYMMTGLTVTGGNRPYLSGNQLICNQTSVGSGFDIYVNGDDLADGVSTGGTMIFPNFTGTELEIECQGCIVRHSGNTLYVVPSASVSMMVFAWSESRTNRAVTFVSGSEVVTKVYQNLTISEFDALATMLFTLDGVNAQPQTQGGSAGGESMLPPPPPALCPDGTTALYIDAFPGKVACPHNSVYTGALSGQPFMANSFSCEVPSLLVDGERLYQGFGLCGTGPLIYFHTGNSTVQYGSGIVSCPNNVSQLNLNGTGFTCSESQSTTENSQSETTTVHVNGGYVLCPQGTKISITAQNNLSCLPLSQNSSTVLPRSINQFLETLSPVARIVATVTVQTIYTGGSDRLYMPLLPGYNPHLPISGDNTPPNMFVQGHLEFNLTGTQQIIIKPLTITSLGYGIISGDLVPGIYDVGFKSNGHLRAIARNVNITSGNNMIDITLLGSRLLSAGDYDSDNRIGPADLQIYITSTNNFFSGGVYSGTHDVDGDGYIGPSDLQIYITNANKFFSGEIAADRFWFETTNRFWFE